MLVLKKYMVCRVCNLGHIQKPSSHNAGVGNVWSVWSNSEFMGARRARTNEIYDVYLDTV